jgi:hypothetical protein
MDPIILLIVGAVGLGGCVILLVLGLNMLREERSTNAGATPEAAPNTTALEAAQPAAAKPEASKPTATSTSGNPFAGFAARLTGGAARGSAHEVLRVLRDNLTGRLMVEIAGKRYANLDELAEGDVRQALMTTLHDLEAFAGGAIGLSASGQPAGAPAAATPPVARQALAARAGRSASEPAAGAPGEYRPLPPPTMNPFKQMAVLREMAKNPPLPPKSITEQIDEVLQEQIIGTPMIHRGLHVRPGLRGDAVFEADGQSYPSVEALPDVEVRDVIRAAIAEWEAKR